MLRHSITLILMTSKLICARMFILFQPIGLQHQYVRPTSVDLTDSERILTEECRIQTALSEDAIRNAQHLPHVLEEVRYILQHPNIIL